ncbi:MAG TPA: hypothetical protein DEO83_04520 [Lachnospiraceae bacterium]|nr:hypothetical protein [Lachnospiraceae bacterium]
METIDLQELEALRNVKLNIRRSCLYNEGFRRSNAKGRSAEFSGYREYIPGDDMRYVDWNAFARLDKLYIKEYMEEREGRVNIYLDTSRSMQFGSRLKSTLMAELTQAISYIALSARDSVYVTDLARPAAPLKVPHGNLGVKMLQKWLEDITPDGRISLTDALKKSIRSGSGMSFIISDFMDESFLMEEEELLRLMNYRRMEVRLIHILSKEELEVERTGSFRFIDSEDETKDVKLTLDRSVIKEYKAALDKYINDISALAIKYGAVYKLCSSDEPLRQTIYRVI